MRPLEDAGKDRWTMADFCVIMAAVSLGSQQIVFSNESCFQLCPDDHRRRVWRRPGQHADNAFTIVRDTGPQLGVMVCLSNTSLARQIARSLYNEHVCDMMGKRLYLSGKADDMADK
ncbi:hypothetical protein TNCV_1858421 [Trichonephila clavipes]|nr:hypothetical protein TNCV_1858421 [Trichonephila clavipes]